MKDYRAVNGRVNGKLLEMAVFRGAPSRTGVFGRRATKIKARLRLAPQSPSFIVHFVNKNS